MIKLSTISDFCLELGMDYKGRRSAEDMPSLASWEWTGDETGLWIWVEDGGIIQLCVNAKLKMLAMPATIQIDIADNISEGALLAQLQELAAVFDLRGSIDERSN